MRAGGPIARGAAACVGALALAACAVIAPPVHGGPEPRFVEPPPAARGGVALVLSGGAARGYAHVGVIKALEAHGLRPDVVVGSSAGSIVGALYASGLAPAELERAISALGGNDFGDLDLPGLGVLPGSMGVIRGEGLRRFIDERVMRRRIEDFPMRFAAVATDLASGEPRIFNAGDAAAAVRASSAVPGVMAPVPIGGRLYCDGQVSSPLPVDAARRLGADYIVAVDVVYPPEDAAPRTALGVLFQAFTISAHRLKAAEASRADIVISPGIARTSTQLSFRHREGLVEAGERAALAAIDGLRPVFVQARRPGEARGR